MYRFICLEVFLFIGNKINDNIQLRGNVKCVQSLKLTYALISKFCINCNSKSVFLRVNISLLLHKLVPYLFPIILEV